MGLIDPWKEPREQWSGIELDLIRSLMKRGLTWTEIADVLVDIGFPARCETSLQRAIKVRK